MSVPKTSTKPLDQPDAPPEASAAGVRYRVPVEGVLIACEDAQLKTCSHVTSGPVPQLGRLYTLPYSNTAFENNVLSATFSDDGDLQSGQYTEKTSAAEVASKAFADLTEIVSNTVKKAIDTRVSTITWETEAVTAQANLLKARAELDQASLALASSEERARLLQADTDLMNAERANIEAKLALEAARARSSGQP